VGLANTPECERSLKGLTDATLQRFEGRASEATSVLLLPAVDVK